MELRPYVRKAHYYETDQMGIVHHSNYIRWFEEARVDFMEQIGYGYDRAVADGIDFAVLSVSCEYRSMVRFSETVEIQVSISALSASRMSVHYQVSDVATGALRTTGESSHCYFDNRKQRPVALPRALPELYALFASIKDSPSGE